jgi:hypothetical protein
MTSTLVINSCFRRTVADLQGLVIWKYSADLCNPHQTWWMSLSQTCLELLSPEKEGIKLGSLELHVMPSREILASMEELITSYLGRMGVRLWTIEYIEICWKFHIVTVIKKKSSKRESGERKEKCVKNEGRNNIHEHKYPFASVLGWYQEYNSTH